MVLPLFLVLTLTLFWTQALFDACAFPKQFERSATETVRLDTSHNPPRVRDRRGREFEVEWLSQARGDNLGGTEFVLSGIEYRLGGCVRISR